MKALATKIRAEKETKARLNAYWAGAAAELAALDELQKVRGTELTEILHMDTALFLEAGEDVKGIPEEASDILSRLAEATRQHQEIAAALQKGGAASIAFTAAARGVWAVASDPSEADRRVMLAVKQNLCPNIGGLAFRVETQNGLPRLDWESGAVNMDANEVLNVEDREDHFGSPIRRPRSGAFVSRQASHQSMSHSLVNV